jgi:hypothetical protein
MRQPRNGGSPVVANDVCCVDVERVKNADDIADRVLQGIRSYSLAFRGSEATQVRRDCAEAVRDEEWDLVAPKICRVRPSDDPLCNSVSTAFGAGKNHSFDSWS